MSNQSCCNPNGVPPQSVNARYICANNGAICSLSSNQITTNSLTTNQLILGETGNMLSERVCFVDTATYSTNSPSLTPVSNFTIPASLLQEDGATIDLEYCVSFPTGNGVRTVQPTIGNGFATSAPLLNNLLLFSSSFGTGSCVLRYRFVRRDASSLIMSAVAGFSDDTASGFSAVYSGGDFSSDLVFTMQLATPGGTLSEQILARACVTPQVSLV